MLKFYNTMTKKKEVFKPLKRVVTIYSCGPTVYYFAHIGNFRSFIFADLLRRYLKYKGIKLKHAMNITDVDDKTIRNSKKEGMSLKDFTRKYEKIFFEDLKTLNIEKVESYPRATEHIKDIVNIVNTLLKNGYAYKTKDGIYYDISKFKDYGKLARLNLKELKVCSRIKDDNYDKENIHDFVLWKFWDKKDGDVFWETNLGKGRPGWHIECSAMSMKYLGKTIDIHTGGVDLVFPHHQNEIAQSEAATGKKFVRYWMHNEHLFVNGEKMSKSLGNFYTLRDLLKKGYNPKAIRYLLLSAHYRKKLNFTEKGIKQAAKTIENIESFMSRVKTGKDNEKTKKLVEKVKKSFENAMDDDLNIPLALASIFDFMREINKAGGGRLVYNTMLDFDRVLGLNIDKTTNVWNSVDEAKGEIKKLILEREGYRKKKDFENADKIREKLGKIGVIIEDSHKGPRWKKQ